MNTMLWMEHRKSAGRNPDLDQIIQSKAPQYITKDVRLGVRLLHHLIHTPHQPFQGDVFHKNPSDHALNCGEAFAQAALLCVGHHDLPLLEKVVDWASNTAINCLKVYDPYCMKIGARLAQLNEKELLQKIYDILYPEKDLTKLQKFRFSLGPGVSPQTMEAIMRSAVEALAWDVLEWITPLAFNYHTIAPKVGGLSPYTVINTEMLYDYASEPQYDEVFVWWLNKAEQSDIEIKLLCCGPHDNLRRMALALQHLDAEHLNKVHQNALDPTMGRDFLLDMLENEISRRQHISISAHLKGFEASPSKRKM